MREQHSSSSWWAFGLLTFAAFLAHAITLDSGPVNQEFVFSDAAVAIQEGDRSALDQFFRYQANSLGLSLLAAVTADAIGTVASPAVIRFLVLAGSLASCLAARSLLPRSGISSSPIVWLALLLCCPMVWCMLSYGTADLLPAMLVLVGMLGTLSVCRSKTESLSRRFLQLLAISGVLALATLLKYHSLWFAGVSGLVAAAGSASVRQRVFGAAVIVLPSILVVAAYGVWTQTEFGFFLVPSHFKELHFRGWLARIPMSFALYVSFVGFALGPVGLFAAVTRPHRLGIIVIALLCGCLAAYATTQQIGEMNLGAASGGLASWVIKALYFAGAVLGTILLVSVVSTPFNKPEVGAVIVPLFGIVLYLVVISFSRPAQRYLVFVLPILLALVLETTGSRLQSKLGRLSVAATVLLFLPISLAGQSFLTSQGNAAESIAETAVQRGVACETDFTMIESHVGTRSRWCEEPSSSHRYWITTNAPSSSMAQAPVNVFGVPLRHYYLVELNSSSPAAE